MKVLAASSADNTSQNKRNKNGDSLTPLKQSEARNDIDLVTRIHREINKDNALSVSAKTIEIITIDGHVTLRGGVKNQQEKLDIEARTAAIAGSSNVNDQLEVAAQ